MTTTKRALITGISGQDGHYLTELLLSQGYEVFGYVRRGAKAPSGAQSFIGDLTDSASLKTALVESSPDEVYNLGAQSHVRASFEDPDYTFRVTALPVITILEWIRGKSVKLYQASTSELFGSTPPPQDESTVMRPRSPYAIAKHAAHESVRLWREAYGVYAACGILFNHECVTAETPVIIRKHGMIDVLPIEEVVPHRENPEHRWSKKYTTEPREPFEVWDRDGWTRVNCMTATWSDDRETVRLHARGALISSTPDHVVFVGGDAQEREAGQVQEGHFLTLGSLPPTADNTVMTLEEAWLLGALAGDGYVAEEGTHVRITNNDPVIRTLAGQLWVKVTGGFAREGQTSSEFSDQPVGTVELRGVGGLTCKILRNELYTEKGFKRVPKRVLNASAEIQMAFLRGYNACDGLKEGHCNYEFKSWKTNSPTLAAGLWWMAQTVLKQRTILCVEDRGDATYFTINLNTPEQTGKGAHLRRPVEEVVKSERRKYTGWLFDLATESGTFHAGIGQGWIHNSPIRPTAFVTRKITRGVANIFLGKQHELVLGNLDSYRDWGHARDYVRAMHLMLQQPEPRDYVVATGETHTVREFLQAAWAAAQRYTGQDLPLDEFVKLDPKFHRPAEVDALRGDATRAHRELGWSPTVKFADLVDEMVLGDLAQGGMIAKLVRPNRDE